MHRSLERKGRKYLGHVEGWGTRIKGAIWGCRRPQGSFLEKAAFELAPKESVRFEN